jgi:tRNA 2-selenouridine synthase
MFRDIPVEELFQSEANSEKTVLIDVRSPSEFLESTIPGSINIPIFNDEERSVIGTLYKQVSASIATDKGLEIFSAKLPELIKQFKELPDNKVVFCWRGGMRSKAMATFVDLMGINVKRLQGGYRAYRNWVVEQLEQIQTPPRCIIINGYTGSGKTRILERLAAKGQPVLDLEYFAGHRGSTFGGIGLDPSNQKTFDSLLVHQLRAIGETPYFLIEAENKRIGKISVPEFIVQAKDIGTMIVIEMPIEERVKNIIREYQPEKYQAEFIEAFLKIKKRLPTDIGKDVHTQLETGEYDKAFEHLLTYYYDPLYQKTFDNYANKTVTIQSAHVDEAVEQIESMLPELLKEFAYI